MIKTWISDMRQAYGYQQQQGWGGLSQLDYELLTHIILRTEQNIQNTLAFLSCNPGNWL